MSEFEKLDIQVPRRLEIDPPANTGPSKFPSTVDQLKTIEYSSVPSGGQLENDLKEYYTILANVANNSASERDYVNLKDLMLRVRNYVLTEDDFNLLADSVRTTQAYMKSSIEAADGNYELISVIAQQLVDQINEWSLWLQSELADVATNKNVGAPIIYSDLHPGPSAVGYLWLQPMEDVYIAPALSMDPDVSLVDYPV